MKSPAVYSRVSTIDQQDTIQSQESAIAKYLLAQGIVDLGRVLWYRDEAVSGATPFHLRGNGSRLLEDAKKGMISYVVVFSISRLSRSEEYDFFVFAQTLYQLGIEIRSVSQNIDTGQPGGRFLAGLMALMDAEQRHKMLAASKAGRERALDEGRWPGKPPFGYKVSNRRLVVDDKEAEVVRSIFRMYCEEGLGFNRIAQRLSLEGTKKWYDATIKYILTNTVYIGEARHNTKKTIRRNGKIAYQKRPLSEHVVIAVPSIVERKVFERAQKIRQKRVSAVAARQSRKGEFILPLVECGHCGKRYHRMSHKKRKRGEIYYAYRHDERADCQQAGKGIQRDYLESSIWGRIEKLIKTPSLWTEHIEMGLPSVSEIVTKLGKVEALIKKNLQALQRLQDAYILRGQLGPDDYDRLSGTLNLKAEELESQRRELADSLFSIEQRANSHQRRRKYLEGLTMRALDATPQERFVIVNELIECITVNAQGVGANKIVDVIIHWRE